MSNHSGSIWGGILVIRSHIIQKIYRLLLTFRLGEGLT